MKTVIQSLPSSPGVYQYFSSEGKLLYVGKAKSLKDRVKSYWLFSPDLRPNPNQSARIVKMLQEASRLEYIVVDTEEDALILENSLIKQLRPKYNILLRDDKTYPYIYIDETQKYPRFEITRKAVKKKGITYYGPFPTGGQVLKDMIYEVYPLVQKKSCLSEGKVCLFYQIKKCLGPCEGKISPEEYGEIVKSAKESILKREGLVSVLEEKMQSLARQQRYEEAGAMRDNIKKIRELNISSAVDMASTEDLDIFAVANGDERGVVVRMFMRGGKIISSDYSYFRHTHIFDTNEMYKQSILDFYAQDAPLNASQVIVGESFEDMQGVQNTLSDRFGKKLEILSPQRGVKRQLAKLALKNCEELLKKSKSDTVMEQRIADVFDLGVIPYRVEIFDNSHLMGAATVGGMVVWDEGKWDKSSYRRYALSERDEYGQMKEMLSRRIENFKTEPPPDLWVLDGGQANLNLAVSLLREANVNLDVVAIAKEKFQGRSYRAKGAARDLVYTQNGIVEFKPNDQRLFWLQRQRDEAHRYAITFHQNKKRKEDVQVSLLNRKGVGKATVKKLLDYFGTFEAIAEASFEDIAKVTNRRVAESLKGVGKD